MNQILINTLSGALRGIVTFVTVVTLALGCCYAFGRGIAAKLPIKPRMAWSDGMSWQQYQAAHDWIWATAYEEDGE